MILSIDQLGREVRLNSYPERIISLVPSQTELLHDLDLDKEVVGITKFCIHPEEWFRQKVRVGGTKNVNADIIRSLQPDLIIANQEENERDQILALSNEFPVWISSIENTDEALEMILSIGKLTDRHLQSAELTEEIKTEFRQLSLEPLDKSCLYLIWKEPFMAAGKNTFIDSLIQLMGLKSIPEINRYPEVSSSFISENQPDFIFLSSEPYPFNQSHIEELKALSPSSEILLVDGEMFSWYGSRMMKSPKYLKELHSKLKRAL